MFPICKGSVGAKVRGLWILRYMLVKRVMGLWGLRYMWVKRVMGAKGNRSEGPQGLRSQVLRALGAKGFRG